MIRKSLELLAALLICISIIGCSSEGSRYSDIFGDEPIVMTEKEKELLKPSSWSDDVPVIYSEKELYYLRKMNLYLKEKYPSYDLEIVRCDEEIPLLGKTTAYLYYFEYEGKSYTASVSFSKDSDPYFGDDFYVYLLGDVYNKTIENMFYENGYSVHVYTKFYDQLGIEMNENTSLDDLLSIYPNLNIRMYIYHPGEYNQEVFDGIKNVIYSKKRDYGIYEIFFYDNDDIIVQNVEDNRRKYGSKDFSYNVK